jgi:hypothetical protein
VGRVSAHYIALLIYTCICAYTIQARSTANGKLRREIQNPQMFETDPARNIKTRFASKMLLINAKRGSILSILCLMLRISLRLQSHFCVLIT